MRKGRFANLDVQDEHEQVEVEPAGVGQVRAVVDRGARALLVDQGLHPLDLPEGLPADERVAEQVVDDGDEGDGHAQQDDLRGGEA